MNDATEWIDPELVAAGKLLQSRGLVAPDRTVAPQPGARWLVEAYTTSPAALSTSSLAVWHH